MLPVQRDSTVIECGSGLVTECGGGLVTECGGDLSENAAAARSENSVEACPMCRILQTGVGMSVAEWSLIMSRMFWFQL